MARFLVLVALVLGFCVAEAVAAPIQCASVSAIDRLLRQKYQERPIGEGTANGERWAQLYISRKGTYSFVVTKTTGEACIVAAGEGWGPVGGLPGVQS